MSSRRALDREQSWELRIAILPPFLDEVVALEESDMLTLDVHGLATDFDISSARFLGAMSLPTEVQYLE